MNLVKSALLAAPLALAPLAVAQAQSQADRFAEHQSGIYGMVTAQNLGSLTYASVGNSTSNTVVTHTDGSFSPIGGTFGGFYDFKTIGRVRLGADVRGSITSSIHGADPTAAGSGGRLYTAMGGVRASFPAHYKLLAPYVQGSFGFARTDSAGYQLKGTNPPGQVNALADGQVVIEHGFAYQALAGLDLKVFPLVDIRIAEFGIGGLSGVQSQPGSHLLQSVGVGLVFHLPY